MREPEEPVRRERRKAAIWVFGCGCRFPRDACPFIEDWGLECANVAKPYVR